MDRRFQSLGRVMGATGLVVLGLLFLGSCDSPSTPTNVPQPKNVLATVYPLASITQQIGQNRVRVQWLAEGDVHPSDLPQNPELIQRANQADLIVTCGPADTWASMAIAEESRSARIVQPEHMPSANRDDPQLYLWLDPTVVSEMVEAIRSRLTVLDSAGEADFRRGALEAVQQIRDIDEGFRTAAASLKQKKVLVVRPIWGAMLARYGLSQVAPVQRREELLTNEDLAALTRAARSIGTRTVFIDASTPPAVVLRIGERTGLRTVMLDAIGTSAPAGHSTYLRLMQYNRNQLLEGLRSQ